MVSTRAFKDNGRGGYIGRRTFGCEELVGPKIPAGGGRAVAERAEVPTLLIGPQYCMGKGGLGHKGRATARQVNPYAWPGHRTHMPMQDQCLHAPQGRVNVSPEHVWRRHCVKILSSEQQVGARSRLASAL